MKTKATSSGKLLVIVLGPTAVGKTDFSIDLALRYGSPVISCDSRQIYKEMTIGTAVPSASQLAAVKHYFIHSHSVRDNYTAGKYEIEAVALMERLFAEGHDTLVMAGGSGFYIDAVCRGLDDFPPADPRLRAELSDRLRRASLEETLETISASAELGASTVTVHPGLSSMAVDGMGQQAMARARESLKAIDAASRDAGVVVAIENMPQVPFFLGRTAADLESLIDGTDLGVCFDIGHANTAGQIDEMIDTFGDRIVNVHIHDNNGKRDEHLTIGDGSIDFPRVLGRMGWYGGNWIIESKNFESAVESQSRLLKMLS